LLDCDIKKAKKKKENQIFDENKLYWLHLLYVEW
jgi:hypothetical protein